MGVSLAVLRVSLRTCWQYLQVEKQKHGFVTAGSDGFKQGPVVSPELRDLLQRKWT